MVVADTSFLIDVLAGRATAREKLDDLLERQQPVWIPAPALHELYYGARLHRKSAAERKRVEELERAMPPISFDAAAGKLAGILEAELELEGKRPGRVDIQIAAIALVRGEAVVTGEKRFPGPKGLPVERY